MTVEFLDEYKRDQSNTRGDNSPNISLRDDMVSKNSIPTSAAKSNPQFSFSENLSPGEKAGNAIDKAPQLLDNGSADASGRKYSFSGADDTGVYGDLAQRSDVKLGSTGVTYTDQGGEVRFTYAIVPAESLVVSHDADGGRNPDYPAELQPRDRTRAASAWWTNTALSRRGNGSTGAKIHQWKRRG